MRTSSCDDCRVVSTNVSSLVCIRMWLVGDPKEKDRQMTCGFAAPAAALGSPLSPLTSVDEIRASSQGKTTSPIGSRLAGYLPIARSMASPRLCAVSTSRSATLNPARRARHQASLESKLRGLFQPLLNVPDARTSPESPTSPTTASSGSTGLSLKLETIAAPLPDPPQARLSAAHPRRSRRYPGRTA